MARRFKVPYRVLAGSSFIEGATKKELDELEMLDVSITVWRFQTNAVELDIRDAVPTNINNAVAKLKFISAILIDGAEIDCDHFAYIVKECAECIERFKSYKSDHSGVTETPMQYYYRSA